MKSGVRNSQSWQVCMALRTSLSLFDHSSLSLGPDLIVRRGIFCTVAFVVESHSAILTNLEQTEIGDEEDCSSQSSHCNYIQCINECKTVPLCFQGIINKCCSALLGSLS